MGKRGRRRTLRENAEDEDYFLNDSINDDESSTMNVIIHNEDVDNVTDEKLYQLCKDYTRKCDHLKYIGPSDIRRFDNEYMAHMNVHVYCAPIIEEFLDCALNILFDEYKHYKILMWGSEKEYKQILESFKYQLCIKLSKYYIGKTSRDRLNLFIPFNNLVI